MTRLGEKFTQIEISMREWPIEVAARAAEQVARESHRPQLAPRATRRPWASVSLATAAAVLLLAVATPVGREAIARAAEWIGIGSEPTKPLATGTAEGEAVIGAGQAPNG